MGSTTATVQLYRDSLSTPWGFRLYGGADLGSPLTIQKVFPCSPSEGELRKGDTVIAVGEIDVSQAEHEEAEKLIRKAGGSITLTIVRPHQSAKLPLTPLVMSRHPSSLPSKQPQSPSYGVDFRRPAGYASPTYGDEAYLQLQRSLNAATTWQPSAGGHRNQELQQPPAAHVRPNVWLRQFSQAAPPPAPTGAGVVAVAAAPRAGGRGPSAHAGPPGSSSTAAHLQYNSPLQLYSRSSAEETMKAQLGDHPAADALKITGGGGKGDLLDSPTLRMVLREDAARAALGKAPGPAFYARQHEFGPGIGPIRQYFETPVDEAGLSDF